MITITRKDSPVLQDFRNESGTYSKTGLGFCSFNIALEAHGYRLGFAGNLDSPHGSILVDILQGDDRVGYAHIAWHRLPNGRTSVTGRIVP